MGEASATAQGLTKPITTSEKLRNSEHKIYLLVDQGAMNGKGAVTGMLKVGRKGLYVFDRDGHHYQVTPPCVLDFYIHETRQRTGLGKKLFEHMLAIEEVQPVKMAIDRPSDKFLGFLNKHYELNTPIKQMNNYVVFDGFFPEANGNAQLAAENEDNTTPTRKQAANGLQSGFSTSYGRYGAPRPPCSMGQIIHNQSPLAQQPQEPTGNSLNVRPPSSQRSYFDGVQHSFIGQNAQTNLEVNPCERENATVMGTGGDTQQNPNLLCPQGLQPFLQYTNEPTQYLQHPQTMSNLTPQSGHPEIAQHTQVANQELTPTASQVQNDWKTQPIQRMQYAQPYHPMQQVAQPKEIQLVEQMQNAQPYQTPQQQARPMQSQPCNAQPYQPPQQQPYPMQSQPCGAQPTEAHFMQQTQNRTPYQPPHASPIQSQPFDGYQPVNQQPCPTQSQPCGSQSEETHFVQQTQNEHPYQPPQQRPYPIQPQPCDAQPYQPPQQQLHTMQSQLCGAQSKETHFVQQTQNAQPYQPLQQTFPSPHPMQQVRAPQRIDAQPHFAHWEGVHADSYTHVGHVQQNQIPNKQMYLPNTPPIQGQIQLPQSDWSPHTIPHQPPEHMRFQNAQPTQSLNQMANVRLTQSDWSRQAIPHRPEEQMRFQNATQSESQISKAHRPLQNTQFIHNARRAQNGLQDQSPERSTVSVDYANSLAKFPQNYLPVMNEPKAETPQTIAQSGNHQVYSGYPNQTQPLSTVQNSQSTTDRLHHACDGQQLHSEVYQNFPPQPKKPVQQAFALQNLLPIDAQRNNAVEQPKLACGQATQSSSQSQLMGVNTPSVKYVQPSPLGYVNQVPTASSEFPTNQTSQSHLFAVSPQNASPAYGQSTPGPQQFVERRIRDESISSGGIGIVQDNITNVIPPTQYVEPSQQGYPIAPCTQNPSAYASVRPGNHGFATDQTSHGESNVPQPNHNSSPETVQMNPGVFSQSQSNSQPCPNPRARIVAGSGEPTPNGSGESNPKVVEQETDPPPLPPPPLPPKLERPQSLSLQQSEDVADDGGGKVDDVAIESKIASPPSSPPHNDGTVGIENDVEKIKLGDAQVKDAEDRAGTGGEARKTPSHLTEQGFFDLKFYHNKLW